MSGVVKLIVTGDDQAHRRCMTAAEFASGSRVLTFCYDTGERYLSMEACSEGQHTDEPVIRPGNRAITPDMALRLSHIFLNSPEFRLNAPRVKDRWPAQEENRRVLSRIKPLDAA